VTAASVNTGSLPRLWRSDGPVPRGGPAAFAVVYERHHQALYRYCVSILRHEQDAQDALQSTMVSAYAALQDESRDIDLRPWLFRIAHNEAVSILRRRRLTAALDDVVAEAGAVEDRVEAREVLRVLRRDLDDLPARQRAALVLRELNGLDHSEIAGVLETSPAAVKQAIFEARVALSKCGVGRSTPCVDVQRSLSDGDGRVLRGRALRAHLRSCAGCRRFRADLERRPGELAALIPPLPAGAAAAVLGALQVSAGAGALVTGGLAAKVAVAVVLAAGAATAAGAAGAPVNRSASAAAPVRAVAVATRGPAPAQRGTLPLGPAAWSPTARPERERSSAATGDTSPVAASPAQHGTPVGAADGQVGHGAASGKPERSAARGLTKHGSAPGQAKRGGVAAGRGKRASAPGQAKRGSAAAGRGKRASAPGQAKRGSAVAGGGKRASAPGQIKRGDAAAGQAKPVAAPGQAKHGDVPKGGGNSKAGRSAPPAATPAAPASDPAALPVAGSAPGASGDAPGHSAEAPGHQK
jgi:RNA polymerase sigma factor (sigma-70 family)